MKQRYVVMDIGSTTTKALLIGMRDDRWALLGSADAATTVEEPHCDVNFGVDSALSKLQSNTGFNWDRDSLSLLATSSAGGGLQVVVCGLTSRTSTASAKRAAVAAGAVVIDAFSGDDQRSRSEKIERLQRARPDVIVLGGGMDGSSSSYLLELAEIIRLASPEPRFGKEVKLPVIYAGNQSWAELAAESLQDFSFKAVDNLRPAAHEENLSPTRDAVHDVFLTQLMQYAPGYEGLKNRVANTIMPTPLAFGKMVEQIGAQYNKRIMALDIGGATTDVFTLKGTEFRRTVSANIGMSYSAGNVLTIAGTEALQRWLPWRVDAETVENIMAEKMIKPTGLPGSTLDLIVEQGLAREAIRVAIAHHHELVVELPKEDAAWRAMFQSQEFKVVEKNRVRSDVRMEEIDMVIGSGGVLSHAPRREQAAMILLDALNMSGITSLCLDQYFTLPHLGLLSTMDPAAASDVLFGDSLLPLATVVTLEGNGKRGQKAADIVVDGKPYTLNCGELLRVECAASNTVRVTVSCRRGISVFGRGSSFTEQLTGGELGLIFDARLDKFDPTNRHNQVASWLGAIGAYTDTELEGCQ